jgi:hypothetical protein
MAIILLCAPLWASTFQYTREATPKTITVGDVVDIQLTVTHSDDITVTPDAIVWPEPFMIQSQDTTKTVSGNTLVETWHYKVAVFEPGEQQIPESVLRQILHNGTTVAHKLAAIPLHIVSILPATTNAVGALKPLLGPSLTLWPWLLGLGCLVLGLWWLWKNKRNKAKALTEEEIPLLSAKEEALLAIETLTTSGSIDRQAYKEACLTMTEILKRFLSRHYHQKMQEMTSEEVSTALQLTPLDLPLLKRVRILLRNCDHIKFANSSSSPEDCYALLKTLRDTISEIADMADPTTEGASPQP